MDNNLHVSHGFWRLTVNRVFKEDLVDFSKCHKYFNAYCNSLKNDAGDEECRVGLVSTCYVDVEGTGSEIYSISPVNYIAKRYLNNNIASITKIHREVYTRMYPTTVILADGSSINIRYHEPRKIIKLPLDLSKLSEEERKLRLDKRKPKKKVKITDDIEDNFNAKKYLKFIKK